MWRTGDFADGWNFGPADGDAQPVGWLVERIAALWDTDLRWQIDSGEQPHEAVSLKLDSSRARLRLAWRPKWDLEQGLAATVEWYRAYRDGADMRAVSLAQIRAYQAADSALSAA
jgi:CDP-glucose 4,6-dehydratase